MPYLVSIDQGTTSSRSIIYNAQGDVCAMAQEELSQSFPRPGWVEHDAEEIWRSVQSTCQKALKTAGLDWKKVTAIGITNQRETIVLWDRKTGRPVAPAIVWQDVRTADFINQLKDQGHESLIQKRTGLILDGYFSASKLTWLLDSEPTLRKRAQAGELAMGTVESWLVYKLTEGKLHITDITNASRTMLMDLREAKWDEDLLDLFRIPPALLPEIVPNAGRLATATAFDGSVPICGMIGDQQSALFGQLCTEPGMVKCTYGTGSFMLMTLGTEAAESTHRLLTTAAWKIGNEPAHFALEGSIFIAGAAIQWLRDGLGIIKSAADVNALAARVNGSEGVVFVPAFTGLGAPHWDSSARGMLIGLTRGTTSAHIARATLEGIASQVADLLGAMEADSGRKISRVRVDGGACASDLLMQIQADLLDKEIERPKNTESTALGAAFMAGLGIGVWNNISEIHEVRKVDQTFRSEITPEVRAERMALWHKALKHTAGWHQNP